MSGVTPPSVDVRTPVGRRRDQVLVTDHRGRVEGSGPGGWIAGTRLEDLLHPDDRALLETAFGRVAGREGAEVQVACRIGEAGTWRQALVTITNPAVPGFGDRLVVTVGVGAFLPERDPDPAPRDELTGLATRTGVVNRLHEPPGSRAAEGSLAVLYIDLDHFKRVNDSLGHSAGDKLLVAVAERLRRAVRPDDTVARLGGDEFVIVAEGVDRGDDAVAIATRVRAAAARPVMLAGRVVAVTATVGAAVGPRRLGLALLEDADVALFQAKRDGRNRVRIYEPTMARPADARHDTEEVLRAALERDGLALAYHPVVEVASGRAWAVEATLRTRDARGVLVEPDSFLEAAEATGLIVSIGAGMLDVVCDRAARWAHHDEPAAVWLPVSARQVADPHTPAQVAATLKRHGLPTDQLWLEVGSETLVHASGDTERNLHELSDLGVHLVMDDFGTGPSRLTCLDTYAVDAVMIDPVLLEGLDEEPVRDQLLRAVLRLGEELDLATVARGVTTRVQAERLAELGCRYALGSYFDFDTAAWLDPRAAGPVPSPAG